MRENGDYHPSDDEMEHMEAVMQLLNVMDRDSRFQIAVNDRMEQKGVRKMCPLLVVAVAPWIIPDLRMKRVFEEVQKMQQAEKNGE